MFSPWQRDTRDAAALIAAAPAAFRTLLADATGQEAAPDLDWNAAAYLAHVVDNLRIWAERLASVAAGNNEPIVGYDDVALSVARSYRQLPLAGSLWSLERSAEAWTAAFRAAEGATLLHPHRGQITVDDVAATNAHDTAHHYFDISRCLYAAGVRASQETMAGSA